MRTLTMFVGIILTLGMTSCSTTDAPKVHNGKIEPPESDVLNLKGKKMLIVPVGTKMYADMRVHGSIGSAARYKIANPKIVKLVSRKLTYLYPERMKAGSFGGDRANRRYVFEAEKPGITEIRLLQEFRGKIEKEEVILIKVK